MAGQFSRQRAFAKTAILNIDDPNSYYLPQSNATARVLSSRCTMPLPISRPLCRSFPTAGHSFRSADPRWAPSTIESPLPGLFNVYNSLAAAAVGFSQGVASTRLLPASTRSRASPAASSASRTASPSASSSTMPTCPSHSRRCFERCAPLAVGRLVAVFGCGGDRDPGRRTGMGAAAASAGRLHGHLQRQPAH